MIAFIFIVTVCRADVKAVQPLSIERTNSMIFTLPGKLLINRSGKSHEFSSHARRKANYGLKHPVWYRPK